MLNVIDTWIKAAVENVVIEIHYVSRRTKNELSIREVEPDFVGPSRNGTNIGCWTTFDHLRNEGPRCFMPDSIIKYKATDKTFEPSPKGRWKELIPEYEKRGLKDKSFN